MERNELVQACGGGHCHVRATRMAEVFVLTLCAIAHTTGCGSEAPNAAVAALDVDDERAQSSALQVLRANNVEMVGGVHIGNGTAAAQYLIFVPRSAQARAAALIAADAKSKGYGVTLHSPGGKETIKADLSRWPKPAEDGWRAELQKVIAECDQAIRLDPDDAKAYCKRGVAHGKQGNLRNSLNDLTKAVQLDPSFSEAFNARGVAWGMSGEFAKAIADFNEAIRLEPNLAKAYQNRALAHKKNGDLAEAKADLERAKELDPTILGSQ